MALVSLSLSHSLSFSHISHMMSLSLCHLSHILSLSLALFLCHLSHILSLHLPLFHYHLSHILSPLFLCHLSHILSLLSHSFQHFLYHFLSPSHFLSHQFISDHLFYVMLSLTLKHHFESLLLPRIQIISYLKSEKFIFNSNNGLESVLLSKPTRTPISSR